MNVCRQQPMKEATEYNEGNQDEDTMNNIHQGPTHIKNAAAHAVR